MLKIYPCAMKNSRMYSKTLFALTPRLLFLPKLANLGSRSYTNASQRTFRYPAFTGSSVVVGTYLCFLLFTDKEKPPKYYRNDFTATLFRRLPFNAISRLACWISEMPIPKFVRPFVYTAYINAFGCNTEELRDADLTSYPTLADFFVRRLADGCRPIDHNASLVSPADADVLYFGPVTSNGTTLEQVKGVYYSLSEFLGSDIDQLRSSAIDDHVPRRQLYQCVLYLSPKDCHRFCSPTDWKATIRRHFPGKLLSVRPSVASRLPGLYTINERVVYSGEWPYGFMSLCAVGALGVGGIHVQLDPSLQTNNKKDNRIRFHRMNQAGIMVPYSETVLPNGLALSKGAEFGLFRFGSTIVLLFDAPVDQLTWSVQIGSRVKMGQALFTIK